MRIAFDSQIFTGQVYGGISRYCASLALSLGQIGQDVTIFAPYYRNEYLKDLPADIIRGRHIEKNILSSRTLTRSINKFVSNRQILAWRPDVIHETNYSSRKKFKKSAVVVTVYDMIHEIKKQFFSKNDKTHCLKREAIEKADHILCISNSTRNDLLRLTDVPESKLSVVHLGFQGLSDVHCQSPKTTKCNDYLLFVGPRSGYKNFDRFIKAVARSKRLLNDFHVIAFGGGALSQAEMELISSLGFRADQVRQESGDDRALNRAYQDASLFVYPSLYEGFGIPPLEAMSNGCPVVCSNSSSIPEVVGEAALFFDPESVDDITTAMETAVYSAQVQGDLIARGASRVKEFSWAKCASETLSAYRSAVARRAG